MKQPVLEAVRVHGSKVALVPASPAAGRAIYPDLASSPEIFRWMHWRGPIHVEDMAARWGDWRGRSDEQNGVDYVFCLQDPVSEQPIGGLNLRFGGHLFCGDLAYWVLPEFQGRGVGGEAVGLATWLSFEHLAAQLLIAEVFEGNEASTRLLGAQGFRRAEEAGGSMGSAAGQGALWAYTLGRRTWLRRKGRIQPEAAEVLTV